MRDIRRTIRHLKQHQFYPALKSDLMGTCSNLSDLDDADKMWLDRNLPDGEYRTAAEVIKTLGLNQNHEVLYA